jgi:hypothetical protein
VSESSVAKENKIAFVVPVSQTARLAAPQMSHPYILRATCNTDVEVTSATQVVAWKARDGSCEHRLGLRLIIDANDKASQANRPQ